jgi:hypothetical protein
MIPELLIYAVPTVPLLVLRLLICEILPCPAMPSQHIYDPRNCHWQLCSTVVARSDVRRKFSQLVSDHVFGYGNVHVAFAVVNLELQPDKVRQYRRRARLCLYRCDLLAVCRADDGETESGFSGGTEPACSMRTHGTMSNRGDWVSGRLKAIVLPHSDLLGPFHTDRDKSARVGNIAVGVVEVMSLKCFGAFGTPASVIADPHVRASSLGERIRPQRHARRASIVDAVIVFNAHCIKERAHNRNLNASTS